MKDTIKHIKKVCGFYVNDWHLTTMILPYIYKQLEQENEIVTILQKGIKENIEDILSKMNLNEKLNNKIKKINWTTTNLVDYTKISSKIKKINKKVDNITILINGDEEFIKVVNVNITKVLENLNLDNKITIINCYDVNNFTNIISITNKYEFILNTSGIKRVNEKLEINSKKNA